MPAGRPSKYHPAMCEEVIPLGQQGLTYTAIASKLGVVRETLYNWMDENPEFFHAMKAARQAAQEKWEGILMDQATTGKGNATAAIFAMKNQFPDDYRDRHEHKVEGEVYHEISFYGYDGSAEGEDQPPEALS